jgi:hypothetical protein
MDAFARTRSSSHRRMSPPSPTNRIRIVKPMKMAEMTDVQLRMVSEYQYFCFISVEETENFQRLTDEISMEFMTDDVERLKAFWFTHEDPCNYVRELVRLCDLAKDLTSRRVNDPERLFIPRGNTLLEEEQDRKVRVIPQKSQQMLALVADAVVRLSVYGEPLEKFRCAEYDHLPPPAPGQAEESHPRDNDFGKGHQADVKLDARGQRKHQEH